jgi:hypothetical protein
VTDFGSLLPPRTAPPRLPSRGGPAAVIDVARSRRRKQATKVVGTGGALSVVVLGVAVLRAPAPLHGIEEGPATKPPGIVVTSPTTSRHPATRAPKPLAPGEQPAGVDGGSDPSAGPGTPTAIRTAIPTVVPSGPVRPTAAGTPVRYVNVLRDDVADRPAEECELLTSPDSADDVLCTRHFAPFQVPSGTAVDFGYEVCAKTNDVTLYSPRQEEYTYRFTRSSLPAWTARERPKGMAGPHEYEVKAGRCIRYTFEWDGRGDDGRPLPVGSYSIEADFPGEWSNQGGVSSSHSFSVT